MVAGCGVGCLVRQVGVVGVVLFCVVCRVW